MNSIENWELWLLHTLTTEAEEQSVPKHVCATAVIYIRSFSSVFLLTEMRRGYITAVFSSWHFSVEKTDSALRAEIWGIFIYKLHLMSVIFFLVFTDMLNSLCCMFAVTFPLKKTGWLTVALANAMQYSLICNAIWTVTPLWRFNSLLLSFWLSNQTGALEVNVPKALLSGVPPFPPPSSWDE